MACGRHRHPGYHNLSDEATTTPVYGSNSQSEPVFSFHRRKTVFIYCQGGQIKIRKIGFFGGRTNLKQLRGDKG